MATDKVLTPIGERLVLAIANSGVSQNEIERRVGLGAGYLARVKYGDRGLRMEIEFSIKIPRELGVPAEWLWLGEGPEPRWPEIPEAMPSPERAPMPSSPSAVRAAEMLLRLGKTSSAAVASVNARERNTSARSMQWWSKLYTEEFKRMGRVEAETPEGRRIQKAFRKGHDTRREKGRESKPPTAPHAGRKKATG